MVYRHFISFQSQQDYTRFVENVDWEEVLPLELQLENDYLIATFESARELSASEQAETKGFSGILAETFNQEHEGISFIGNENANTARKHQTLR